MSDAKEPYAIATPDNRVGIVASTGFRDNVAPKHGFKSPHRAYRSFVFVAWFDPNLICSRMSLEKDAQILLSVWSAMEMWSDLSPWRLCLSNGQAGSNPSRPNSRHNFPVGRPS